MPDVIERFTGPHRFLSNFYPAPILWDGIFYPTTEHAFNAGKTLDVQERIRIAGVEDPAEAKRIGRSVQLRPDWDERVRYEVMAEVLALKFMPGVTLGRQLRATGNADLIEGNTWHDTHWGVCRCARHNGHGENHLGRLLMERRAQLHHGGMQA